MGHEVKTVSIPSRESPVDRIDTFIGYAARTRFEELQKHFGPVDLFLYVEPLGLIPEGIDQAPFVTAAVLCDMHNHLASRQHLARFFDHVFLYQRNYISKFTEHPNTHIHWLPYACDTEVIAPVKVQTEWDVAFVGQLFNPGHERRRITNEIGRRWRTNPQRYYPQAEIPLVYSAAKIVINLPLKDDLNFRTFEAMSCGAMLLTRRIANGQEILFKEGQHFVAFSSEPELYEQIEHYLTHEEERARIAAAGLAEVRAKHTLELRLERLLQAVSADRSPVAPIRKMGRAQVDRCYALLYEQWYDATAGLQLLREARKERRPWAHLAAPAMKSVLRLLLR